MTFYQQVTNEVLYQGTRRQVVYHSQLKKTKQCLALNVRYNNNFPRIKYLTLVLFFSLSSQVLFNQFKYFFNLYFLLLACSQFVNELRLGALYTYWVPLVRAIRRGFVLLNC